MSLITDAELLAYVPDLSSVSSSIRSIYIGSASDAIEKYCNRQFNYDQVTERIVTGSLTRLYLKLYPVDYIISISLYSLSPAECSSCPVSNDDATNMQETLISCNTPYHLDKSNGMVNLFPSNLPIVTWYASREIHRVVTYCGGFKVIPDSIKLATALLVKQQVNASQTDPYMKSEKIGDYSYESFGTPDSLVGLSIFNGTVISQLIAPYKRLGANGL